MKKVKLYIAQSLDGFIARPDGNLDWLDNLPHIKGVDYGYSDFIKKIDTVIMGRDTYKFILDSGIENPYPGMACLVVSSRKDLKLDIPDTSYMDDNWPEQVIDIKSRKGKDIWLAGGGKLITGFLNLGLVDEMIISIIPVILGAGIPLFPNHPKETNFELTQVERFETGIVNVAYRRPKEGSPQTVARPKGT